MPLGRCDLRARTEEMLRQDSVHLLGFRERNGIAGSPVWGLEREAALPPAVPADRGTGSYPRCWWSARTPARTAG